MEALAVPLPCGSIPLGLHSPGATFPWGIIPLRLYSPRGIIPPGLHSPRGSFPWGFIPLGLHSPGLRSPRASSPLGSLRSALVRGVNQKQHVDRRGSANENFDPSLYLIGPYLEAFNIEAFGLKTFNIAFIVRN